MYRPLSLLPVLLMGCGPSDAPVIVLDLVPSAPEENRRLMWSPRGEKLALDAEARSELHLGGPGAGSIALQLLKSEGSEYYDQLWLDLNGNGMVDEAPLSTTPNETRGKIWSSFDAVVDVPASHPDSGEDIANPYPLAFWYVFDPIEEAAEEVIRYSRRGWMEGDAVVDGVPARIMLTESVMDGVFDTSDSWAIAGADSADNVLAFRSARSADRHAWLGERAYRLVSVHPSGRRVTIQFGDVGITRAAEAAQEDRLAVDRAAVRSGRTVVFEATFEEAERRAGSERKNLFVDFKTVWCGPCYTMDEWVFTADRVVDLTDGLVSVKVDGDERRDLARQFDVQAYPTLLLLDPDGAEIRRHVGYLNVDSTAIFLGE